MNFDINYKGHLFVLKSKQMNTFYYTCSICETIAEFNKDNSLISFWHLKSRSYAVEILSCNDTIIKKLLE